MRQLNLLPIEFDVSRLVSDIQRQPTLWNRYQFRNSQPGGPHEDIDDIWIRYNDFSKFSDDRVAFNEKHESVWYPEYDLLPRLRPIIFQLMAFVEGEQLGGILITRIPPGKGCLPHKDGGWHASYYDKYIVQLESTEGQSFNFEGESLIAKPGQVYWFDNSKTHWVVNDSDQDRMSLIICIRSDRR